MLCFKCAKEIKGIDELPEGHPARLVVAVIGGGPAGGGPYRCAVVCWTCRREIEPNQWISDTGWDSLSPAVPFRTLPSIDHEAPRCWDIDTYAHVLPSPDS